MGVITSEDLKDLTVDELRSIFTVEYWKELPKNLVDKLNDGDLLSYRLNVLEVLASREVISRFIENKC
jgi:lysozyme family protein